MKLDRQTFGTLVATALATAVLTGTAPGAKALADDSDHPCQNNSCKGKSSCMGYGNSSCAGQNSCKGTGWLDLATKAECEKDGQGIWHGSH